MLHQKCDKYVDYVLDELFRIENQSFTNLTMECSFVPEFENASWAWIDPITNLTRSLKLSLRLNWNGLEKKMKTPSEKTIINCQKSIFHSKYILFNSKNDYFGFIFICYFILNIYQQLWFATLFETMLRKSFFKIRCKIQLDRTCKLLVSS